MSMGDEIADHVKDRLRAVVDSFQGVLGFEINRGLSEAENVHRIIRQSALVCAVIGCITKIPMTDFLILTPIHAKMTLHIAKAKGFEITKERALDILRELLSTIGLSLTGVYLASFIKMIPVLDVLFYVPIIYGTTYGIGRVVEVYFHGMKTGKLPTADELRDVFKRELSFGKIEGASLKKAQLDQAYAELKKKVDEREAARVQVHEKVEKTSTGNTPLGIRIKEKPVRRPVEKTFGEDAPLPAAAKPEPEPPRIASKTIGPATPAAGIDIKAAPLPMPPPAAAPTADDKQRLLDDLERLAKLKEVGALTPEEFEVAKKKLLGA